MNTRLLLLAAAASFAAPAVAAPITLIDRANGIQVDAAGRLQRFDGLLIDGQGRVARLLRPGEARPRAARRIDLRGATVLPGLIDAHGHVIDSPGGGAGLGLVAIELDLAGTSSLTELQRRLKAYAAANPGAGWITGRGWNQERWPDKRFPTAADLDAVVADRPVWLTRVDGHAAVGNSAALRAAALPRNAKDPTGGKIERAADGAPTGLFIDNAIGLVANRIPAPTTAMMDRAMMAAQDSLLSYGVTAAADMGTSASGWRTMQRLATSGRLKVRIMGYADGLKPLAELGLNRPTPWLYGDRLRLGGVKLYADGALGSRGAWLKRPYADQPDTRGLRFLTDADLRDQATKASGMGFQLAIHAIGDAANDQVIGAFERVGRDRATDRRTTDRRGRIEHVQVVDPADIPRIARAGLIASMQPTHQTSDRLMVEKRLDPPRLEGAYAWATIARSGARLAFGSDFPVESPNPFPGLAAAVSRQDPQGQPPGGWRPHERVTFAQALSGFTRDAAYAGFAEDRIGSLDPGKWADFIILDSDPTRMGAVALAATRVRETWIAGRRVYVRPNAARRAR